MSTVVDTLLDTNVLSELLRPAPSARVLAWFAAQPGARLFVSAVTEAEMLYGARLMPAGRRRRELEAAGFVYDGSLDVLRNPADTLELNVFDEKIRGKTDQFVLRFRRPSPRRRS